MTERTYFVEDINPARFFGPHNSYFKHFKAKYNDLKISSRGSEIMIKGEEEKVEQLVKTLDSIVRYLQLNEQVSLGDVERLIDTAESKERVKGHLILHGQGGKVITARTRNQQELVEKVEHNDLVFAVGPAGTGKTYTAVALAVRALKNKEVKKIILCRPAVEAGESLGFLPGDMKEKVDPYLRPLYDALGDMIPAEKNKAFLEKGVIEVAPMAFMRGRTLDHCFVILDEGQNATEGQLKMFLTRMGPYAKVVVTGDLTQIDLPPKQKSGLAPAIDMLKDIDGIGIVRLNENDVVRHPLVKKIIKAYREASSNNQK